MKLSEIKKADTFTINDTEFIKVQEKNNEVIAVTKNIIFDSSFGENNNLNESYIIEKLQTFLAGIEKAVGAENVIEFETNLTTLDGLKPYPPMKSKISLPTLDFYRENVEVFDKYKLNKWWWLATPDSASAHGSDNWILCVAPSGYIDCGSYYCRGVRPVLRFQSSILIS